MCVLGVLFNDDVEVFDCLLVHFYHLVGFGSLVDVANVRWNSFHTARIREDGFFEFFLSAVSQANVVVNISFICDVGVVFQSSFKCFDALFEFFAVEVN
jgi:hypothetical protein